MQSLPSTSAVPVSPTLQPASIASTWAHGSVPEAWRAFGTEHGLWREDLLCLLNQEPWEMSKRTMARLIELLTDAIQTGDWRTVQVLLAILIRSDLCDVFDVACQSGLGWLALEAANQDATARGAVGGAARLGRVLDRQLKNLLEQVALRR